MQHKYISFSVYLHIPIITDEGFKVSTTFYLLIIQDFSYVHFSWEWIQAKIVRTNCFLQPLVYE